MGYAESLRAGRRLMAAGQWSGARDLLSRALARRETAEALDDLGATLWWLGEIGASLDRRERAYELYLAEGDLAGAAMVALDISVVHLTNLDNEAASLGWVARAESIAARARDTRLEGWVALLRGYSTADRPSGRGLLTEALRIGRDSADVDLELVALADLGLSLVSDGEVAGGLTLLDEAMAGTLGGGFDRLETVVWTSCSMLAACSLVGDLRRAAQWCRAADRFMVRFGCPFLQARCRAHYGRVLVGTGHWQDAETELDAALAMAQNVGAGPRVEALTGLADLRLRQGRVDEAAALVADVGEAALAAIVAGQVELATGHPERAVAVLRSRLAVAGPVEPEYPVAAASLVEALLAVGDVAAAERQAGELATVAAGHQHPQAAALAALSSGRVDAASGRGAEAARSLRRAVAEYQRLDLAFDAARARLELACATRHDDPDLAAVEAGRARHRFVELGASSYAASAAAVLRDLGVATPAGPRSSEALSVREREVLALLEHGLTNPQIGERLFISRKTVAHHVSSILAKLGLTSRAEAAAYAARHRTDRA